MRVYRIVCDAPETAGPAGEMRRAAAGSFSVCSKGQLDRLGSLAGKTHGEGKILTVFTFSESAQEHFLVSDEEKLFYFRQCGVDEAVFLPEGGAAGPGGKAEKAAAEYWCGETVLFENEETGPIRAALSYGDIALAHRLLGHPYLLMGKVVPGKQLGRTVGMPTANLRVPEGKILPAEAVYCTGIFLDEGREYHPGVTNIGTRPSVDDSGIHTIETNILDFDRDIYGETIGVEILSFLREITRFSGLPAVQAQVRRDREYCLERLEKASD